MILSAFSKNAILASHCAAIRLPFFLGAWLCAFTIFLHRPEARDYIAADSMDNSASAVSASPSAGRPQRGGEAASRPFVSPSGKINLFGTVEFKRPDLPAWIDLLARNAQSPIFIEQKAFNKSATWGQLKAGLEGKPLAEQMKIVNSFWNAWPYKEDMVNWGMQDYWEIPAEFLKKSGDCEDYAIVKYFTLKELGVDPKNMRIVVLRDTIRNLAHAVLVVYTDGDAYVLDNLSNVVPSHRRLSNYSPQYSVNEYGRWTHLKGK